MKLSTNYLQLFYLCYTDFDCHLILYFIEAELSNMFPVCGSYLPVKKLISSWSLLNMWIFKKLPGLVPQSQWQLQAGFRPLWCSHTHLCSSLHPHMSEISEEQQTKKAFRVNSSTGYLLMHTFVYFLFPQHQEHDKCVVYVYLQVQKMKLSKDMLIKQEVGEDNGEREVKRENWRLKIKT